MVTDIELAVVNPDVEIPIIQTLPASLFSARGKLPVKVVAMSDAGAVILCADHPPGGPFAFLVRNGIKLPATIASIDDAHLELKFEATPDAARRHEAFQASGRRPAASIAGIVFSGAEVGDGEMHPVH